MVLYLAGSERSGSTLMDLLLNNHPNLQSVGEVHRLNWYARDNPEPCTCGEPVIECKFWREVELNLRRLYPRSDVLSSPLLETEIMLSKERSSFIGRSMQEIAITIFPRRLAKLIVELATPSHAAAMDWSMRWYCAVLSTMNAKILLDSSKDARRLKLLYLWGGKDYRLIYMLRDGRAVTASNMRRNGCNMKEAVKSWLSSHRRSLLAQRSIPTNQIRRVKYEDLCLDAGKVMNELCQWLGLEYSDSMLAVKKDVSHNIGGNPMRFRKDETAIQIDEQWRRQLSESDLEVFERIGGEMNRLLGY